MSSMSLFETFMKIFFKDNIFRAVLGSQQNQKKVQRFPIYPLPCTCTASPIINMPTRVGHWLQLMDLTLAHHSHPKSIVLQFTLSVVHCMGLEKSYEIFTDLDHPQGNPKAQKLFCLLESSTCG